MKKISGGKSVYDDRKIARIILIVAVIMNFFLLIPLFDGFCMISGDGTAHYAASQAMVFRMEGGFGVFGVWNQLWALGFPAYSYYQYFAHLVIALIHFISFKLMPVLVIQKLLIILAVSLFPLSVYYGLTTLKLRRLPAAFASLFAFTLSSSVGHGGLGMSLVHHGVFTQLLGVFIFPIALARIYITLSERRSYFPSIFFLSLLMIVHPITGYACCIASVVFLFEKTARRSITKFLKRSGILAIIILLVFVVTSHFFVPLLAGSDYYGGTFMLSSSNYYQGGAAQVLSDFFTGKTLDSMRFPFVLLTVFFFIGVYCALAKKKDDSFPIFIALSGLVLFLLISFGRSFWGILFDIIPGMSYIIVFRLVFALQFFALFFVGAGLAFLFMSLRRLGFKRRSSTVVLLFIFILFLALPAFAHLFVFNNIACKMINSGFDGHDFSKLVLVLKGEPDGRFISRPEIGFSQPYFESLLPVYGSHDSFSTWSMGSQDNLAFFYTQFFGIESRESYDLFNVRYAVIPSDQELDLPFFNLLYVAGNYSLYDINTSGYFDLVDSSTALLYDDSMNSDFVRGVNTVWMNSRAMKNKDFITMFKKSNSVPSGFDYVIEESAIGDSYAVMGQHFNTPVENPLQPCGELMSENRSFNLYIASVNTNRSCDLLFKMSYHPDWNVVVNGKVREVKAVSPSFMAVSVEPGFSAVRFYYQEDLSLRYWLLAFGIFVLLGVLFYDVGLRKS